MKPPAFTFYVLFIVATVHSHQDDTYLRSSSPKTTQELIGMVTHTAIQTTGDCGRVKRADILLFLYTRDNPTRSTRLTDNNLFKVNPRKKTILLIHGWISDAHTYGFQDFKNEYLKRYDCNVIIVDWSIYGYILYTKSVCFLPKIAHILANSLCLIRNHYGLSLDLVHLVGHSLGGQMSGMIGHNTKVMCKETVGRITAMDPAGPLYQGLPISQRLDRSDASFVDVIHSNEGVLGYFGNCGHVDFYPNCGSVQPGCPTNVDVPEAINYPPLALGCDHWRSVLFMIESIHSNNFKAKSCKSCPIKCVPDDSNNEETIMGEGCTKNTSVGGYVLQTNDEAPYGKG